MIDSLIELATSVSKYCVGMEGNISGKLHETILIKASGAKLKNLSPSDLVQFDFNGNQQSNFDKKGSMELSFHTFLLNFEDINFVSHTHPTNALKILCGNLAYRFAEGRIFPDQVVFNGPKSCLVPYAKPGPKLTALISKAVYSFIETEGHFPKLILLKNHGIISCGKTIDECIIATEICEKSADIFINCLGRECMLSKADINDLVEDDNEKHRQGLIK